MGIHVLGSKRLRSARRLVGGVMVGSALALAAPAGLALAADGTINDPVDTRDPADSNPVSQIVSRPNFNDNNGGGNPAPVVRATQLVGDQVFNQSTPVNSFIDNTFGNPYHERYGYPGGTIANPKFDSSLPSSETNPQYIIVDGENGTWQGALNNGAFYNFPGAAYDAAQDVGLPLPAEGGLLSGQTVLVKNNTKVSANTVIGSRCVTRQEASCPS